MDFTLKQEFIELFKLLKFLNLAENGAEAKQMIADGLVLVNGETETRKAYKVRAGDQIQCGDETISVH